MRTRPNGNTYEIDDWVSIYSQWDFLLDPEAIVLERLKSALPTMRMLDIGVGGGRTTRHFANLAQEYIGIDNDESMIRVCRKTFPSKDGRAAFELCDCRSMGIFQDDFFDFAQFSFNGLDYMRHGDRLKALREIWRVTKKGGYFFFSTHNLNSLDRLFSVRVPRNPVKFARRPMRNATRLWQALLLVMRNDRVSNLKMQRYAMINDGVYHHKLKWLIPSLWKRSGYFYYSKPEEQVRQLQDAGFRILEVYSPNGARIEIGDEMSENADDWLHYLCEVGPAPGGTLVAATVA